MAYENFWQKEFEQIVYLNFESSERLKNIFKEDFNIERIIAAFDIETKKKINFVNTILIFDEIQEAEKGLTALKYFYEHAPQYYIIAAGSLLGVSIQKNSSFPVGKVDFLQLFPMSFMEFLENLGEERLTLAIKDQNWPLIEAFHQYLITHLRHYYLIGGMPEVVAAYIATNDLNIVRNLQQKILLGYENDFAKYAPNELIPKIKLVWISIISQLAKENKKFIYGQIKKSARAKDFEMAINWLVDAGLILKVNKVQKPTLPLNAYTDFDSFKLFLIDIGLLNALAGLDQKIILEKNNILVEFKGALTEQYVCQQLKIRTELYYWTAEKATAEIDFLIQLQNEIIPIEVKAEENLKAKSLKIYVEKFKPQKAIRTSMNNFREESWLINIPLYGIDSLIK